MKHITSWNHPVQDYASGVDWLAGGRKKWDRPLYTRGFRIRKEHPHMLNSNLVIYLPWYHNLPIITIKPDNTMVLQTLMTQANTNHGWRSNCAFSQGVRDVVSRFTGIDMYQKDNKIWLHQASDGYTPSKLRGCGKCSSTGKIDEYCWGPNTCYKRLPCELHPDAVLTKGASIYNSDRHEEKACEHGKPAKHMIPMNQACYCCSGSGKINIGGKRISSQYDGYPLHLKDGKIIRNEPTELEKRIANYVRQ